MTQKYGAQVIIGFMPAPSSFGTNTLLMNAAATWMAYSFSPAENRTLSKVKTYLSAVAGTAALRKCSCDLYSSSGGLPNASLETIATSDADPAVGWMQHSGFTTAVNAGTLYWLVFKNTAIAPTVDTFTFRYGSYETLPIWIGGTNGAFSIFHKRQSNDSGATWGAGSVPSSAFVRLEYSDATFDGFPIENAAVVSSANRVFSLAEMGVKLTTPANAVWRVKGLWFQPAKGGNPTGSLRYRLYNNATWLADSAGSIPAAEIFTSRTGLALYFSDVQVIQPGTVLRAVMGETTQSDTSSNTFTLDNYTIENDANSKALFPFGGVQFTRLSDSDGVTWTDTDTQFPPFGIIFDTLGGEFAAGGGGGGGASMLNVGGGQLLRAA